MQEFRTDTEEPRRLPQTYAARPTEGNLFAERLRRHDPLGEARERMADEIKAIALEVLKRSGIARSPEEIIAVPVGAHSDSSFRARTSFRIIDTKAAEIGQNDRIDLVTVELRRVHGRRDEFVPIVHPHEYGDFDIGAQIRRDTYSAYERRFGSPVTQLIRSPAERLREEAANWLYRNWRAVIALGVIATGGVFGVIHREKVMETVGDVSAKIEQYQKERAEEARLEAARRAEAKRQADLASREAGLKKVSEVLRAVESTTDVALRTAAFGTLPRESLDAVSRKIRDNSVSVEERLEAVEIYERAGRHAITLAPAKYDSDERLVEGFPAKPLMDTARYLIVSDKRELRYRGADMYKAFYDAQIAMQGGK